MNTYDVQREFQGTYTHTRTSTDLMVHHAAALYPTYRGIDDVRSVARFHVQTRGWPGIGYHVVLSEETQNGPIARYNCSDLDLQRAHIAYRNHEFLGVACLTNFNNRNLYPDGKPSQKWLDALAETLRDLKRDYPHASITGHRDETVPGWGTTCPGDAWHLWKPELLRMVDAGPVPPAPGSRWYTVVPNATAIVREGPSRWFPEALDGQRGDLTRLRSGTTVESTSVVIGEEVAGDNRWVHLANHIGFIHMSALQLS